LVSTCVEAGIDIKFRFKDEHSWYKSISNGTFQLSKFQEPYDDTNPSIFVTAYSGSFTNPESYFSEILNDVRSHDDHAIISSSVQKAKVGQYAAYYKVAKAVYHQTGKAYPIVFEYWAIPKGKDVVIVTFNESQTDKSVVRDEAMEIINGFQIEN
jgi:hypothetical protein